MKPPDIDYTNDQQVFDYVAKHLLTQQKVCAETPGGMCVYRSPDGKLACAIGCLLTDEEARLADNWHSGPMTIRDILDEIGSARARMKGANVRLLGELQAIHDCAPVGVWKEEMESSAHYYTLDWRHE